MAKRAGMRITAVVPKGVTRKAAVKGAGKALQRTGARMAKVGKTLAAMPPPPPGAPAIGGPPPPMAPQIPTTRRRV